VPPVDPRHALGRRAEAAAAAALERAGYRLRARRFRTRAGEIDLVVEADDVLVFVEVKARSGAGYGRPAEAVDRTKRARLAAAAQVYLQQSRATEHTCRFDVVEVHADRDGALSVDHIVDAFRPAAGDRLRGRRSR
jgi:putative endonuclease